MSSLELTGLITALPNALASGLNDEEILLLASIFVQLGDTLATLGVYRALCNQKTED